MYLNYLNNEHQVSKLTLKIPLIKLVLWSIELIKENY